MLLGDEQVHLTRTEFRLLCELADQSGRVLSRQQLLDRVWGYDVYGDERLVDVHIGPAAPQGRARPGEPRARRDRARARATSSRP